VDNSSDVSQSYSTGLDVPDGRDDEEFDDSDQQGTSAELLLSDDVADDADQDSSHGSLLEASSNSVDGIIELCSQKGSKKIAYLGYIYTLHSVRQNGEVRWRCVGRKQKCRGVIHTSSDLTSSVRVVSDHNHSRNNAAVDVIRCRIQMKDRAKQSRDKPGVIYAEAIQTLDDAARTEIASAATVKRTRNYKTSHYPDAVQSLHELVIDGKWAKSGDRDERDFLFYDNGVDAISRLVVFGLVPCLELLARSTTWYMDGNFGISPKLFLQLYVIHAPLADRSVPCVYALMECKTQESYEELLTAIDRHCTGLGHQPNPAVIITDYEVAVMQAIRAVFGDDIVTRGCFFHLTQSTWRKIQELPGLSAMYKDTESLRHFCGMLDGLAFVPIRRRWTS
jgi:hypothetical protein